MLMQFWNPETAAKDTIFFLTLAAGCGIGSVLFRAVTGRVQSSLDVPYRDARNTVLLVMSIGVGIVLLLSDLLGSWFVVMLPLTFSLGVVAQASMFSRRHSVSLRRALPFSLAIAAIPIVVIVMVWCTALVTHKVLRPYWDIMGLP